MYCRQNLKRACQNIARRTPALRLRRDENARTVARIACCVLRIAIFGCVRVRLDVMITGEAAAVEMNKS